MLHVKVCTEDTIAKLMAGIKKACLGESIAIVFEEGEHGIVDQGKRFTVPNGTMTVRIFVNGGAQQTGVTADVLDQVRGRASDGVESRAAVQAAVSVDSARSVEGRRGTDATRHEPEGAEGPDGPGAAVVAGAHRDR